jgi:hypothetical protein
MEHKEVIAWGPRRDFLDMAYKLKGSYAVRESNDGNGERNQPSGPSLSVVFTEEGAAKEFIEAIAAPSQTARSIC